MGEVARGERREMEWVRLDLSESGAVTHSVIPLSRADSSPIKGEQVALAGCRAMAYSLAP